MRSLTSKQKKALKELARIYKSETGRYPEYEDIPYDDLYEIDMMNPCEIFYQNVNNFLDDLIWNDRRNQSIDRW